MFVRMEMIHVIGSRVACEAQNDERPLPRIAELLHPERTPLQNRLAAELQRLENVVGGLRRAGERAWEDLRMSDHESRFARDGSPRELHEPSVCHYLTFLWVPGEETLPVFRKRIVAELEALAPSSPDQTVVVVTHEGVIRAVLARDVPEVLTMT
mgnify:CR=1 FL=1